jgi:pyruvate ferredoxin oxidoreductase gamma subunit/2-oxoisovalerate ferredoxin oxidoreductase gamma subunit
MVEIRIHSRGGQGGVIAGKILAVAAFKEGKYVQTFPSFGVERRAAPVLTFVRLDDHPIRVRNQVYKPDHVVVMDASLLASADVTMGLKEGGWILINSAKDPHSFSFADKFRIATVDASAIALKNSLGTRTQPIVNTAILGAISKVLQIAGIESVVEAIREEVPSKPQANEQAARDAYQKTLVHFSF